MLWSKKLIDQIISSETFLNDNSKESTVHSKSHCALIETRSSTERTTVSKNWIKQLHTLPVLHFNHCLTTEYSETTAHFNSKFDTDNQMYIL
jgi:hypothetical protein